MSFVVAFKASVSVVRIAETLLSDILPIARTVKSAENGFVLRLLADIKCQKQRTGKSVITSKNATELNRIVSDVIESAAKDIVKDE